MPGKNRPSQKKRKKRWVGIDGEGIGLSPHRYVLLAWSDGQGNHDYLERPEGIETCEALEFLLSISGYSRIAGYYLNYDWTKILEDLPGRDIYRLFRPETRTLPRCEGGGFSRIRYKGYRLHYLAGAMTISRFARRCTVWDIGKFFQKPFIRAIEDANIAGARDMVERMKDQRGTWGDEDLNRVRSYCLEECRMLAELAESLETSHHEAGVKPRAWYGPGSTAKAVMTARGVHNHRGKWPAPVQDAAARAYFGGRFEHRLIGRVEDVCGYDLKSAYPAEMRELPCLEHATWRQTEDWGEVRKARIACIRYTLHDAGPGPWGPLPCRLSTGSIVWPRKRFSGWAWKKEYLAAWRNPDVALEFHGAWVADISCGCEPFAWVDELFAARMSGTTAEKQIFKLALNSGYGVTAQKVGGGKYASRIWAGLITSGTRARILDWIRLHPSPESVIAIATDGVFSTARMGNPENPWLGDWEATYHGPMWFVRPGIYWAENDATIKARGVGNKAFREQLDAVKTAIEKGESEVTGGIVRCFGSARQMILLQGERFKRYGLYGKWFTRPQRISLEPAPKRAPDWSPPIVDDLDSAPYNVPLSPEARELEALGDLIDARR